MTTEEEDKHWISRCQNWRENYDKMSYNENRLFYNEIYLSSPNQFRSAAIFKLMFKFLKKRDRVSFKVLELGGWDGKLARRILNRFQNILSWYNVEICDECIIHKVCFDTRYTVVVPDNYLWNIPLKKGYDIFVASHVFEHMKAKELVSLLRMYSYIPIIFCEVPIYEEVNWSNFSGTHILEWTMTKFKQFLKSLGYELIAQLPSRSTDDGFAMLWKKHHM